MESWVSGLNQQSTKLQTSVSFLSSNLRLSASGTLDGCYKKLLKAKAIGLSKELRIATYIGRWCNSSASAFEAEDLGA